MTRIFQLNSCASLVLCLSTSLWLIGIYSFIMLWLCFAFLKAGRHVKKYFRLNGITWQEGSNVQTRVRECQCVMHVWTQQRRRIHHCCNRGQRCPACLWETESQWPACNRHSDSVLTESKGRDPLLALVEWSEAPGPVSNTERGDWAPERRRLKRPLMAVYMCQIVVFARPGGEWRVTLKIVG